MQATPQQASLVLTSPLIGGGLGVVQDKRRYWIILHEKVYYLW